MTPNFFCMHVFAIRSLPSIIIHVHVTLTPKEKYAAMNASNAEFDAWKAEGVIGASVLIYVGPL